MKRALLLLFVLLPCLLLAGCNTQGNKDTCTVTFSINGENTVVEVAKGETPVCPEEKLSWETSEHYYKVTGWDKEIVPAERDVTYTATVGEYGLTVYDVRFVVGGREIFTVKTHEGETPTPPEGYETDLTKIDKIGAFAGWDKPLAPATGSAVYTASYTYTTRYYTVKFKVGDKEFKVEAAGNTVPTVPAEATRAAEALVANDICRRFTGWDKEITAVKKHTTYTAEFGSTATLMPAKDGAKGICTMTYDDGYYKTAVWVNQKNKQYGLTGSVMMVPNWNRNEPDFTHWGGSIEKWRAVFADGTLEPQSHSTSHEGVARFPDESSSIWEDCQYNNYQENYQYELVQAVTELKKAFPDFDPICFAPSNNILSRKSYKSDGKGNLVKENGKYVLVDDGGATKVAEATYYAIRKGNRTTVQTLDPTPDGNVGGWYNLAIKAFKDYSEQSEKLSQGKKWLDDAVRNGTWLIVMCHGVGQAGEVSNGDIRTETMEQFFAYASQFIETGDLWPATFGDATKYIRERQNTTVSQRLDGNTVYVEMKINRTTSDGKYLSESVFNYPLTVEVRVPAGWAKVAYANAGTTATADTYVRDGATYAMVNVSPGKDGRTTMTAVNRLN